jgi:hypothetical protein
VSWALAHPGELDEMGRNARLEYERFYTPEHNYALLTAAYRRAAGADTSGAGYPPAAGRARTFDAESERGATPAPPDMRPGR